MEPEALCQALNMFAGDGLLHVCCHNPTGVIRCRRLDAHGDIAARVGWLPFFDFAYQGFGDGLAEDRSSPDHAAKVPEARVDLLSKNRACTASAWALC